MEFQESIKGWAKTETDDYMFSAYAKKPLNKASIAMRSVLLALLVITVYALGSMDNQNINIVKGIADTFHNFNLMLLHPYLIALLGWKRSMKFG